MDTEVHHNKCTKKQITKEKERLSGQKSFSCQSLNAMFCLLAERAQHIAT